MKKSKLQVIRDGNKITVKKKVDISLCLIFATVFISTVLIFIHFNNAIAFPGFWVLVGLCTLANISAFLSLFFGKVVIDCENNEISIYNLAKDTHRFDEVKEIRSFFKDGGDGGMDTHKIVFLYKSGRKSDLHTTSKAQTEELVELLSSIIFAENN